MTVNYTTNLALGQPVTGTESGTWGDDVNNAVTSYLDIAIAGGLSVPITTADVTLTLTQGTSSATNIGSTTAQYAIINVTGAKTAARNLIVPSSSRHYIINNAGTSTGGPFLLTVKGAATTGITIVDGEKAIVAWNGTDYVKIVSSAISNLTGTLPVANGGTGQTVYTDGQLLIGNTTGSTLAKATLTAGSGVTIVNGAGSITISATGSGGTVTSVSVTSGNGFAGTVATATSTPAITLSTSITGLLFGNGTAIAAATISSPLSYATGTLSIPVATTSADGYLSSTDWTTFNGKAASGANADITSMTALTAVSLPSAATTSAITITGRPVTGIGTVGGAVSLTGGIGSSNATANGAGGAVNITGGAGGSTSSSIGGTGGGVNIVGGAGSTTNSNTLGGAVTITAGASSVSGQIGAGVTISGSAGFAGAANATGGSVTISGGSGGSTGTTGTGGSITINSGAGTGSAGQAGSINFNLGATTSAYGTVNFQQGTTTKASIDSSGNLFTGAATATLPSNSGTVSTGTQFGFKNKFINGNQVVSYNSTSSGSGTGSAYRFLLDRWLGGASNAASPTFTAALSTASATSPWPSPTCPIVTITNNGGSGEDLIFAQRIEANNLTNLYSTDITISLFCSTSASSTVTWATYYPNTIDTWQAPGSSSSITNGATLIATGTFTTTSSLAYKTITTNVGSNVLLGLMVLFTVTTSGGVSASISFGPLQLERGSIPTPFENRAFGTELALCQRYYERVGAYVLNTVPTAPYNGVPYRVQKRAAPSISYAQASGSGAVFSATSYSAASINYYIYQTTASSGSSEGYVNISAEL